MDNFTKMCEEHGIPEDHRASARLIYDQLKAQISRADQEDTRVRIGAGKIISKQINKIRKYKLDIELIKQAIELKAPDLKVKIIRKFGKMKDATAKKRKK
jgi:hypothetical protein